MSNHSGWRGRQTAGSRPAAGARQSRVIPGRPAGAAAYSEPEVRRWPHPVTGTEVSSSPGQAGGCVPLSGQVDAALYYIHCALSYQNQLLADITALLEQLVTDRGGCAPADSGGTETPASSEG